ncbi:MAG TPA: HAMP domain-containing sensor histidine kinase [Vicinamibacterales bacterium]|nr:HAMP domain-containing sensor histidine kinase [Vicinamibacterales bacterium]
MTDVPSSPFLSDVPASPGDRPSQQGFESELADRLAWFVRLRWAAAASLGLVSIVAPVVGFHSAWPGLLVLGVVVAFYNAVCWRRFTAGVLGSASPSSLRSSAVVQIGLDLAALLVAVHFTGGLASPLLPFFGFHMAIGTILLGTETMYFVAGLTSLAAVGLHVFEWAEAPTSHPELVVIASDAALALALLAFVGFLFGIVYLTGSVSDRLKQRNQELRLASEALGQRSAELQRTLAAIEELERRKSHYMRVSAHQLRSPLGTVRTSLDVLIGGYVDLGSERAQRLLRGAADRVDGLLQIVNGLLDLAKVREGLQRAPWTRNVNLNQLLADLFDSLAPYAEERQVQLTANVRDVVILGWGIPPDLVHAFENLVQNAIKYSLPHGEVTVHLQLEGEWGVLRVEDRGIGVPSEFRDQLFLEFLRAPNAREHASEGTGLGLALVREVAVAHGGRVSQEERQEPGAVFRLELPIRHLPPAGVRSLHAGYAAGYGPDTEKPPGLGA